jgi:amino acid permease
MSKEVINILILILISLLIGKWVQFDSRKRGLNDFFWGVTTCLFWIVVLPFYIYTRKKHPILNKSKINNEKNNSSVFSKIVIPEICPHCKSPNTKKIRLCEWCGNQII